MESNRTRPGGGRPVAATRPPVGRPGNRRRHDRLLRAVPDPEPAHVAASREAEETAVELIASARREAAEESRLASQHAARCVELLRLADSTERVIRA